MTFEDTLRSLDLDTSQFQSGALEVNSPIDGKPFARVALDDAASLDAKISSASNAFQDWRRVPAPRRGELVRLFGEELRANKEALGALVTHDCGKIYQEGLGEVQEMIDICDFAVGLSRQLHGLTIVSERPGHRMSETWHPAGTVGVISAFNFPVAVWSWNTALALVCGDSVIWKPSEKSPVTALACQALLDRTIARFCDAPPEGLASVVIGAADLGQQLVDDRRVQIISATGSTAMGRKVGPRVAKRFGKSILELGGNNAMIVAPSADLDMAVRAIVFSAVGTAGQRCTTLRRVICHADVVDELMPALKAAYRSIPIGDPLDEASLVGPLIDRHSYDSMQESLARAGDDGGQVTGGGRVEVRGKENAYYVEPAIVQMPGQTDVVRTETFAPILYVLTYTDFENAIAMQNDVPQGLSSCVFTRDLLEAETFLSAVGSDCGIANVNIGPSGAEIGGAFGGEKETGGGRESGSDAWRGYMRRQTNTVNYSSRLPLAQGIKFEI
jgi:aldehyde dehydrogenase (NAD+)